MFRKLASIIVFTICCSSINCVAQEKSGFLKTLGKVVKALSEESSESTSSGTEGASGSAEERSEPSRTSQSSEGKENPEQSTPAGNSSSGIKITSPHNDYFFDPQSCKVSVQGQNVVLELLVTNKSAADQSVTFGSFTAFDNLGNQTSRFYVTLGNERSYYSVNNTLPKDIPVKMKFEIPLVDPAATKIARITTDMARMGNVTIENVDIPR